jgi:site-specific DNA-methyltransferase (adenine-specific)
MSNNETFFYSHGEIAFTTIRKPLRVIQVPWDGYRRGKETGVKKIHPHQKPVELYKKILARYAKPGWSILDTHLGSGSAALACLDLGFHLTACEIDEHYLNAARERIALHASQMTFDFRGPSQSMLPFDQTGRQAG